MLIAWAAALLISSPAQADMTLNRPVTQATQGLGRAHDDLPAAVLADLDGAERAALDAADPKRGERTREVSVVRTQSGRLRIDAITVAADDASAAAQGVGSGTSMAAPFAAAAAAVRAKNPALTAAQVRSQLTTTAQDLGVVGFDPGFGWGIINPVNALTVPVPDAAGALPSAPGYVLVNASDGSLRVTWTPPGAGSYRVTATDATGGAGAHPCGRIHCRCRA